LSGSGKMRCAIRSHENIAVTTIKNITDFEQKLSSGNEIINHAT
jgi:hypothetical protein